MDTKALPLAYKHMKADESIVPNPLKICDYKECRVIDPSSAAIRLACFHTFHISCHNLAGGQCPICTEHLSKKIDKIAASFNESILKPTANSSALSTAIDDHQDEEDDAHLNDNSDPVYYDSPAWESHIDEELHTFNVAQPQLINCYTPNSPCNSQPGPVVQVRVTSIPAGSSMFWFLPTHLSQATLFGRNGSNACTFIALFLAKSFILNHNALQLNTNIPLSVAWITIFISSMASGNQNLFSKARNLVPRPSAVLRACSTKS